MILNTLKKETLFFDDNVVENKNQKKFLLFQLLFKDKNKIIIKHKLNVLKNKNTLDIIYLAFKFDIFKIDNYIIINKIIYKA